ncbi:ADP-ribose pyrophosphatase [Roseibium hamelinense]|uniref:GDP-mannose pyrophosphatase n=1 Tax=Roseibium hamelinense TaxID=150831 RepID=A0A562SUI4_9HYPH|nr:NUDIX hydrolase [Roseibium hamelinense]MTI43063.1 NUDIX hydrolase [Roseibium hamelinense]TWI84634.1 ADP-ribose pyrophosphatase [Roseibium hamelinense]
MADTLDRRLSQDVWQLLGSQKVFEAGHRLLVSRQSVQLPCDRIIDDYYQVELPSFSAIFAVNENDELLVLEQYKHGVGQVCLTLPGGQVEPGESPEFAARRELLEETGYGGGLWLPERQLVVHGNQKVATAHIHVATNVIQFGLPNSGDLETSTVVTMPRSRFRKAVLEGRVPIASHVAAFGLAESLLASR